MSQFPCSLFQKLGHCSKLVGWLISGEKRQISIGNNGVLSSCGSEGNGSHVITASVDACVDLSQLCPFSQEEMGAPRLTWQRYCVNPCRMKNLSINLQDQGRTLVQHFIS